VIVGQQVALTGAVVPGNQSVTKWNWLVPGYAISNFVVGADTNGSQVIALTATNAAQASWYWVSGGAKQVVATAVLANGAVVTGKVDFTVLRPTVTVTTSTSDVAIENNDTLKFGANGADGIVFRRSYGNLYGGNTFWAQVISNSDEFIRYTNGCYSSSVTNHLDSGYPYNENPTGCVDTPAHGLQPNQIEVKRRDIFRMFLMYKPPGTDVIHVPLSLVEWQWSGHAVRSNGVWQLQSKSHSENPGGVDPVGATSGIFPVWLGIATGGTNDVDIGPCP